MVFHCYFPSHYYVITKPEQGGHGTSSAFVYALQLLVALTVLSNNDYKCRVLLVADHALLHVNGRATQIHDTRLTQQSHQCHNERR